MDTIEAAALEAAVEKLVQLLRAEADGQNAYIFRFPDGRVSLELEWLDVASLVRAVIAAYVERANASKS